jgi:hypothetical protein
MSFVQRTKNAIIMRCFNQLKVRIYSNVWCAVTVLLWTRGDGNYLPSNLGLELSTARMKTARCDVHTHTSHEAISFADITTHAAT